MTIVVRADKKSGLTKGGAAAKLISLAVIKAYEAGQIFDPISLMQWETNSWAKICLKVHSDDEIREIAAQAAEVGLNHYLLERPVVCWRKPDINKIKCAAEEEKKNAEAVTASAATASVATEVAIETSPAE